MHLTLPAHPIGRMLGMELRIKCQVAALAEPPRWLYSTHFESQRHRCAVVKTTLLARVGMRGVIAPATAWIGRRPLTAALRTDDDGRTDFVAPVREIIGTASGHRSFLVASGYSLRKTCPHSRLRSPEDLDQSEASYLLKRQ